MKFHSKPTLNAQVGQECALPYSYAHVQLRKELELN